MSPGSLALKGVVLAYQWTLRPVLGCNCRFHPSCSDYALEALSTHGAMRGAWLAGTRILRCNPWHPGGYDPVPDPRPSAGRESPRPQAGQDARRLQAGQKG
ncbi:membrane protein insertion efficiency factor YidD [Siccirubricoccus sp. G192]|uniref:membrane protein insertion efficiency factor YidD n=1 Tax=Siccirubricoccus sp. G192 TaxID=2849651 RepID=UPI001C2BB6D2|nr:membrane protein insertion efficiency factor YidD [Siccirubricoccus sp. G192]MBV1799056.1 membrane protein insertion efficiency factor YidD [Siccirubricoccus sp. G192]